jgi:SAM-dependent methyltransferase
MTDAQEPSLGPKWAEYAKLPGLASVIDPADSTGAKNALIDRLHRTALDVIDRGTGQRILDFGCGTGRLTDWLRERGADVLGVDTSPEMVSAARTRVPSAQFEVLKSCRILADDAAFDAVLSVGVLQYLVTSPRTYLETIRELARVLAPRGKLIAIEQVQYGGLERGGSLGAYREGFAAAGLRTTAWAVRFSHSRIIGRATRPHWIATLPGIAGLAKLEARRVRPETLIDGHYVEYLFVGSR